MSWLAPILADDSGLARTVLDLGASSRTGSTSQIVILMTAIICVAAVAGVFCLIFFRKRPKKKHTHRPRRSQRKAEGPPESAPEDSRSSEGDPGKRRKWRRMRRPHRPRNPTLAETGGLPPIREGPPPAP